MTKQRVPDIELFHAEIKLSVVRQQGARQIHICHASHDFQIGRCLHFLRRHFDFQILQPFHLAGKQLAQIVLGHDSMQFQLFC